MSTNIRKPSLVDNNTSSPPIVSQTETSDNLSSTSTSRGMIMPAGESNEEVSEADNRDAEQQSSSDDVSDISSELSLPFRCLFKTRSGFIFFVQVHDFEEATLTYNIKQDIRDKPSKLVVYKSYKPFVCGSVSRDILDRWVFRYVQVESELVKGPIWAKFNKTWRSMEDHGRDAAFERVRSNLYAAKMLRHFQKALKTRWVTPEKVLKKKSKLLRRTLHATSRGLQNQLPFGRTRWNYR
ncbi:uncharacterized protein MELLADRAFT_108294 [Melampsora larici-populina 98AG31]|uniref:Uncharacterized protein n=1 Tax=Melampsora larici-populina (strain 98AG31 / pathotype 3-4-7) TaxID=747676 RepID=F4RSM0_MELLP|nr:uncharacterized protein MELLADRAFT_108294 [Melampsora larici-populina 98AG31]EGG04621.1 hypothetical protein MELLADRAFT_108294 [Melampsora larici-populina 98AG31]